MVNFSTWIPDCDSHSPALLGLFLSFDGSLCSTMAFSGFGNSDHVVVSVFIDFPSNSKQDFPFHRISYMTIVVPEMIHGKIFLNSVLGTSADVSKFCEWFQVQIDVYLPLS